MQVAPKMEQMKRRVLGEAACDVLAAGIQPSIQ